MTVYGVEDSIFTTQEGAEWYAMVRGLSLGAEPDVIVIDDDACLPPDDDFALLPIIGGFVDGELISLQVVEDPMTFFEGAWGDHNDEGFTGEVHIYAYSLQAAMEEVYSEVAADFTKKFGETEKEAGLVVLTPPSSPLNA